MVATLLFCQLVLKDIETTYNSVCFDPVGGHIAAAADDGKVHVWDVVTQKLVAAIRYAAEGEDNICHLSWSPDGVSLAVPTDDGVRVLIRSGSDWKDGFLLAKGQVIKFCAWSSCGRKIALGGQEEVHCSLCAFLMCAIGYACA